MLRKVLLFIAVLMTVAATLSAQTPAEKLILKYKDTSGSREFSAEGIKMNFARTLIKSTTLAPVADDVSKLYVLRMAGASKSVLPLFKFDLKGMLKNYSYYGKAPSKNGEVDVYIHRTGPQTVDELVIYNPAINSLTSLVGNFSVNVLLQLDGK